MFYTYKTKPAKNLSKTWQQAMKQREIIKNNYHATGDIKKAHAFVKMIADFRFEECFEMFSEKIVFSAEDLAIPLRRAYIFAL